LSPERKRRNLTSPFPNPPVSWRCYLSSGKRGAGAETSGRFKSFCHSGHHTSATRCRMASTRVTR
jgi:hypothetical protein